MNSKKKAGVLTCSLFLLAGCVTTTSLLQLQKKNPQNVGEVELEGVSGIELTNRRTALNANGTTTITVNYVISPKEAEDYTLYESLVWSATGKDSYESQNWGEGEDPLSYVSYTNNLETKELSLTCLKPFGRTIDFTLGCQERPEIKATLNIDYVRKQLDPGKALFKNPAFTDKAPVEFDVTLPTYSIGSKGEKLEPPVEITNIEFRSGSSGRDWDSLFPGINLNGYSDTESVIYDDGTEKKSIGRIEAREKMKTRARKYMEDVVKSVGAKPFSKDELINILSFEKKPNPYVSAIKNSSVATSFISNYKYVYTTGGGLLCEASYNGNVTDRQLMALNFSAAEISNISFDNLQIDF